MEQPLSINDFIVSETACIEAMCFCEDTIERGLELTRVINNLSAIKGAIEKSGITAGLVSVVGNGIDVLDYKLSELSNEDAIHKLTSSTESFIEIIKKTIAAILANIKQFIFEFIHNIKTHTAKMNTKYKKVAALVKKNGDKAVFKDKDAASILLNSITHKDMLVDYNKLNSLFTSILSVLDSGNWKNTRHLFGVFTADYVDTLEDIFNREKVPFNVDTPVAALDVISDGIANTEEFLKLSEPLSKQLKRSKVNKNLVLSDDELDPIILLQLCTRVNNIFIKAVFGNLRSYFVLLENIKV